MVDWGEFAAYSAVAYRVTLPKFVMVRKYCPFALNSFPFWFMAWPGDLAARQPHTPRGVRSHHAA